MYLFKKNYHTYFGYNLTTKQFVNSFEEGLVDSAKTVRAAIWSLTIVSTIITSIKK